MADYKERFEAMKAAEAAMKTTPKQTPYSNLANAGRAMQTKDSQKPMTKEQAEREAEQLRELEEKAPTTKTEMGKKKGGCIKMAKGGTVGSASKRADGIAQRGKTRGKVC